MTRMARIILCLVLLAAACRPNPAPADDEMSAALVAPAAWQSAPPTGVQITGGLDSLRVRTTPHAVVWNAAAVPRTPPYRVRATLHKRSGRLHEGYGLVFGAADLEASEERQRYSYFLVRGDGTFLIKRRDGATAPVVVPWTANPAVGRDADGRAEPVMLDVDVGTEEVVFRANGAEVARVPAAELHTAGIAGLRLAHDVDVAVRDWSVEGGVSAVAP